jgi:hypothetical protein
VKEQQRQQECEMVAALVGEDLEERIVEGVELRGQDHSDEGSLSQQNEGGRELLGAVELEFDRVQHIHFKLIPNIHQYHHQYHQ